MAPRNPFRRKPKQAGHYVTQVTGHGQAHATPHQHGPISMVEFREGMARADLPKYVLEPEQLPHNPNIGQQVIHSAQREHAGRVVKLEGTISTLSAALKSGTMLDISQEPYFDRVSGGSSRTREKHVPVLGRIPVLGRWINYFASIPFNLASGKYTRGTMQVHRKLTPEDRAVIHGRIEQLKKQRGMEISEFEGLLNLGPE